MHTNACVLKHKQQGGWYRPVGSTLLRQFQTCTDTRTAYSTSQPMTLRPKNRTVKGPVGPVPQQLSQPIHNPCFAAASSCAHRLMPCREIRDPSLQGWVTIIHVATSMSRIICTVGPPACCCYTCLVPGPVIKASSIFKQLRSNSRVLRHVCLSVPQSLVISQLVQGLCLPPGLGDEKEDVTAGQAALDGPHSNEHQEAKER